MMLCQSVLLLWLSATAAAFSTGVTSTTRLDESSSSTRLSATWSDSRAVKDYQDFLSSGRQEVEKASDQASVIIHDGVNTALAHCLKETGMGDDVILTPDQPLPAEINGSTEYPIYITIPPYSLKDFLMNLGDSYRERNDNFCFFSGGMSYGNIEDLLKERGYCRDSMTQCLIGGLQLTPSGRPQDLSVTLGLDSYGENKMANECTACGKFAGAFAERLTRSNVRCSVDFYREWRRKMWERSFHDAVFHLLGSVRDQPTTVADVANYYDQEVSDMCWDLSQKLRGWRAVTLLYGFEERLFGTAEMQGTETPTQPLPDAAMYPFLWGMNVYTESQMVVDYLWYAQTEKGYLQGVELPRQKADGEYTSHMRKGNLRADGVI
eukprot:scaffold3471_cov175-Amphora_coffeaeformis.AAC.16